MSIPRERQIFVQFPGSLGQSELSRDGLTAFVRCTQCKSPRTSGVMKIAGQINRSEPPNHSLCPYSCVFSVDSAAYSGAAYSRVLRCQVIPRCRDARRHGSPRMQCAYHQQSQRLCHRGSTLETCFPGFGCPVFNSGRRSGPAWMNECAAQLLPPAGGRKGLSQSHGFPLRDELPTLRCRCTMRFLLWHGRTRFPAAGWPCKRRSATAKARSHPGRTTGKFAELVHRLCLWRFRTIRCL